MIATSIHSGKEDFHSHFLEVFVSDLLEELLGERILAVKGERIACPRMDGEVIKFEGMGAAMLIDFMPMFDRHFKLLESLWSIERAWKRQESYQRVKLVEDWRVLAPSCYHRYHVYSYSGRRRLVGPITAGAILPEAFPSMRAEITQRQLGFFPASLSLTIFVRTRLHEGVAHLPRDLDAQLSWSLGDQAPFPSLTISAADRGVELKFKEYRNNETEDSMADENSFFIGEEHMIPLTLEVGGIELRMSDLLALRPGSVIQLIDAERLEGVLRSGRSELAEVALSKSSDGFKLEILGYCTDEASEKRPGEKQWHRQETLGAFARTTG